MAQRRASRKKQTVGGTILTILLVIALFLWNNPQLWEGWIPGATPEPSSPSSASTKGEPAGEAKIWYIDVGQGDSILVQLPGEDSGTANILIDAGTTATKNTLCQWLQEHDVDQLDIVIATHPHEDHIGGMAAVLQTIPADTLYMPKTKSSKTPTTRCYENMLDAADEQGVQVKEGKAGLVVYQENGALLELVGPTRQDYDDLNAYSIVARLTYGERTFLFTGDCTKEAEEDMLQAGMDVSADVLKMGHHGSSTSTGDAFFQAVSPQTAVITCGVDNDYGHPHREILALLEESGIAVYRTDEQDTILASCDGEAITWQTGLPSVVEK